MGFPAEAMAFYDELRLDNSREFWLANKDRYDAQVRGPIEQIAAGLSGEFGESKVYRPYRDVRFRADKSPYKLHQGAHVSIAPACGWYLEVNAEYFAAGGGFYHADSEALARLRKAIAEPRGGAQLERILEKLAAGGWQLLGDRVKTAPRGYSASDPRIELLRHKSLYVLHEVEPEHVGVEQATARVAQLWREVRPLLEWVAPKLRA